MRCIPVDIELQDGTDEIKRLKESLSLVSENQDKAEEGDTSISKMIQMVTKFVNSTFFVSKHAFNALQREAGNITLIIRGKKNTVAFEPPEQPKKRGRGRSR